MATTIPQRGRPRTPQPTPPQAIKRGESYTLDAFKEITGLGSKGLRDAKAEGLRVVYVGKLAYVRGDDWHDWLGDEKRHTKRYDERT
jgi:hypothetical protein